MYLTDSTLTHRTDWRLEKDTAWPVWHSCQNCNMNLHVGKESDTSSLRKEESTKQQAWTPQKCRKKGKRRRGASLVAQWLRIHPPVQGRQVWSPVQEDPTCRWASKPVRHNYWGPCTTARAAPTERRPHATTTVAPARCNQRKPTRGSKDPAQPQPDTFFKKSKRVGSQTKRT